MFIMGRMNLLKRKKKVKNHINGIENFFCGGQQKSDFISLEAGIKKPFIYILKNVKLDLIIDTKICICFY